MSLSPEAIDALVAAGVTAEQLAAVVKAQMAADARAEEERRIRARDKKRRQRADVPACPRDNEGHAGTDGDTPSPSEVSPHTPLPTNHSPSPPPPYSPPTPTDFDRFWAAYPAKVGKKAAERAWRSAKDRPPLPSLLAALERYRRTKPADRDWCNPATWLNQGRWMDGEPGPASAEPAEMTEERWRAALALWAEERRWAARLGPPPDSPGCRAPPHLLPANDPRPQETAA